MSFVRSIQLNFVAGVFQSCFVTCETDFSAMSMTVIEFYVLHTVCIASFLSVEAAEPRYDFLILGILFLTEVKLVD